MDTPAPDAAEDAADDAESLYDRYLDAALAGCAEDPGAFLARHPFADVTLRARIEALHRVVAGDGSSAGPAPVAAADGLPFERLGEFRLLRRLDEGGMGTVFLAEQTSLGRVVALKVLRTELQSSPTAGARLEREALAAAKLDHPNVAKVYAFGEDQGVRYLALEFVPGRGLDDVLDEARDSGRRLDTARVLRWGASLARALACAHAAHIVHRDVKPSNVRITPDDRAVLVDFGIARDLDRAGLTRGVTLDGSLVGSPVFAAPEQFGARGREVDARTDVYGLGATLYACLAGRDPFEGDSFERLVERMLHAEPTPLRHLDPTLPRDVETVIHSALQKDPERRFATADAFADDLEALLAFRPIRARAPGVVDRASRWVRLHPAASTALGALCLFVAVALGWAVVLDREAERERLREARESVAQARQAVERYREARAESQQREQEVASLRERLWSEYLSDDELARLDAEEARADSLQRTREEAAYAVLDLLRRAEQLDPDVEGVTEVRARLYLERWHEARNDRDAIAADFYRDRVLALDAAGAVGHELTGAGRVSLTCTTPGAAIHLFRFVDLPTRVPGAQPRQVPAPIGVDEPDVTPGTLCLVVLERAGELAPGDLILDVDGTPPDAATRPTWEATLAAGGAMATVYGHGERRTTSLPAGVVADLTAAPVPFDPGCHVATGATLELEPGAYLAVARAPGHEVTRRWFDVSRGLALSLAFDLVPDGTTPRGFVRVVPTPGSDRAPFFVLRHEVTLGDYAAFLADPATVAEIAASPTPIRFPRDPTSALEGGFLPRDEGGVIRVPPDTSPRVPVFGVSRDDAVAYAAWWGARHDVGSRGLVADIPTHAEWVLMCATQLERRFVFGNRFRPRFASSCYARETPGIEDVLTYPVDESAAGVHDLAGGLMEWVSGDYVGTLGRLCGGSWARAKPEEFEVYASRALRADTGYGESGFRIVLRPAETGR